MTLAYLILAHQNPDQVFRLLEAIYAPENFYAIHIDRKSARDVHRAVTEAARKYSNLRIIQPRSIHWGGWSMVQATLDAISVLLQMGPWQYFFNLSGQDYPLKNQEQIARILSAQATANFLEAQEVTEAIRMDRLNYFHVELPSRVYRLPIRRNISKRWTPYWGSQWMTLRREFAEFSVSHAAQSFRRYFRRTAIPDEFFFPTLAMNSEFRASVAHHNLRWIEWERDAGGQIAHHPRTLNRLDLQRALQSGCLFARKVDFLADESLGTEANCHNQSDSA